MFSQSADQPAADESPAPIGMRELPPQPAKPVMPVYTMPAPVAAPADLATRDAVPGAEDSVIARDDHFEGTFTSRGTVVVMGSVKGRIEAVRVRIEDGAKVDADVIVDEAIIAGEFTGNLTCRGRLEAHASGRIHGRVETHKLMLHEGASVEGEMHMLTESPRDASETIRGTAPLRGEAKPEGAAEAKSPSRGEAKPEVGGEAPAPASSSPAPRSASSSPAPRSASSSPAPRSAPAVVPSSSAKSTASPVARPDMTVVTSGGPGATSTPVPGPGVEAAASPIRNRIVETLRAETLRVAPRTTTSASRQGNAVGSGSAGGTVSNGSRSRGGNTTGF